MPMNLLASLAQAQLPLAFDDLHEIGKIGLLEARGHVQASIPPWRAGSPSEPATVFAVTDQCRIGA